MKRPRTVPLNFFKQVSSCLAKLAAQDTHATDLPAANSNLHLRGYIEEGTITTALDMRVQNKPFHLVQDVVDRVPHLGAAGADLKQEMADKLVEHGQYIDEHSVDMPEIRNWEWGETK